MSPCFYHKHQISTFCCCYLLAVFFPICSCSYNVSHPCRPHPSGLGARYAHPRRAASTCVLVNRFRRPKPAQDKRYVGRPLHISIRCLLGRCLIAGLGVSLFALSGKKSHKVGVYWDVKATTKQIVARKSVFRVSDQAKHKPLRRF